jgi:branched-chain amino acid transport system permease protein
MAVGAYSTALLTIPKEIKEFTFTQMPHFLSSWIFPLEFAPLPGVLVAALLAALVAAAAAVPIVRLAGIAASIATLAVLVMSNVFITQTPSLTLGTDVINGIPITTTLGGTVIWVVIVLFGVNAYQGSRHGLRLRASRENESAARAAGVNVALERGIAFVLAGFIFGLAGALYAHFFVGFAYTDFYFELTFLLVAMLVVGGMKSLTGAVVGCYAISVIYAAGQRAEVNGIGGWTPPSGSANILIAVLLLLALILRPAGLTGGREVPFISDLRRRRRGNDEEVRDVAPVDHKDSAVPVEDGTP